MKRTDGFAHSMLNAAWLRWAVLACALAAWVAITFAYPSYFQRDDADMIYWAQHHLWTDSFVPTTDAARWHDNMYRPLRELSLLLQYRAFGMQSQPWHIVLGLVFVFTMVSLFKLVARARGYAAAYLMVAVWLGAFNFLLTSLFWFCDIPHVIEMLLLTAGLYCIVSGVGRSAARIAAGSVLTVAAFMCKEPAIVTGPLAISVYLLTGGASACKWGRGRAAVYAAIPLLAGVLYLAAFPYVLQRQGASDAPSSAVLGDVITRLMYYGGILTSGVTGLLLLMPAAYSIITRLAGSRSRTGSWFLAAFGLSVILPVALAKMHMQAVAIPVLIIGWLLIPRQNYFLLPLVLVPLGGLLVLKDMYRSYLYEASFAIAVIAALQLSTMLGDLQRWWVEHVRRPVVTYAALGLLILAVAGGAALKLKSQVVLLKARSDITMSLKSFTPHITRLPRGATVVVFGYESMGHDTRTAMRASDLDKIQIQGVMIPYHHANHWTKVIGRNDLAVVDYSDYRQDPETHRARSQVFFWLMTRKDHEFMAGLHLPTREFAGVRRGQAAMDMLELIDQRLQGR